MRTPAISPTPANRLRLPDGTRSAQSPWVWRGFFFLSLIAFGLALTLAVGGQWVFAGAWLFITAGWFGISMWLWRKNILLDRSEYAAQLAARRRR